MESKEPTGGPDPGYSYEGIDCIFYEGKLYWESNLYTASSAETVPENLVQVAVIGKRSDHIPVEELASARSNPGDMIYVSENYPDSIFVFNQDRQYYARYKYFENGPQ